MTWFKVDDGFWSHPKTATLSDAAVTLWVRAGSYSCQHLTDGVIKRPVLRLVGDADAATELVEARLWITTKDGWRFHDWDEYQETSEAVKKRRDDARERQRKAREARENKRALSQGSSRVTDAVTTSVSSLPPTRPDPTRPDLLKKSKNSSAPAVRVSESDFESAWAHWPKKVERKKSLEKFKTAARKRGVDELVADIIRFGDAYARTTERQYTPALNVWLNGERWTDDLPTAGTDVINKQWDALMGESRDPCADGHKWVGDGSCARYPCPARRNKERNE